MSSTYEIVLEPVLYVPADKVTMELSNNYPEVRFHCKDIGGPWFASGPREALATLKYDLEKKTYG